MAVTCTKKFSWAYEDEDGERRTRIYFPGDVIEDPDAAAFAEMQGHAEERGLQTPARAPMNAPDNKARKLGKDGGENKGKGGKETKRAKNAGDDTLVLGTEDEIPQDEG